MATSVLVLFFSWVLDFLQTSLLFIDIFSVFKDKRFNVLFC